MILKPNQKNCRTKLSVLECCWHHMFSPLHFIWHHDSMITAFVMSAISYFKKLHGKWIRRTAKDWPCVQATIEFARARKLGQEDDGAGWVGELAYSYSVNGEYFSGFYHFSAKNKKHANELVEGWKDRKIMVRYKLDQPEISVLHIDEQAQIAFAQNLKPAPWIANPS